MRKEYEDVRMVRTPVREKKYEGRSMNRKLEWGLRQQIIAEPNDGTEDVGAYTQTTTAKAINHIA